MLFVETGQNVLDLLLIVWRGLLITISRHANLSDRLHEDFS